MSRRTLIALVAALALAAGCGDDDDQASTAPQGTETGVAEAAGGVSPAQAEKIAREAATAELVEVGGGFTVPPEQWKVSCSGGESGDPWTCDVSQGPCSGTVIVQGEPPRGGARVGCVAD